jgi:ligand-binding sensor domain-containing protein
MVYDVIEDPEGALWVCTDKGITRYAATQATPSIQLLSVTADQKYGPRADLRLSSSEDYLVFELQGLSYKTRPDHMVYDYRLYGYHDD